MSGDRPGLLGVVERRVVHAARYTLQGLAACYRHEEAFRVEAWLSLLLAPLAYWLATTPLEFVLLMGAVVLVMTVELLNSAIEAAVDRIGEERHVLAGRAKDQGSAAVFFAMLIFVGIWGAILWQRLAEQV